MQFCHSLVFRRIIISPISILLQIVVEPVAEEAPKEVDAASNVSIAGSSTSSPTAPKAKNRLYTCPLDQVRSLGVLVRRYFKGSMYEIHSVGV